MGRTSGTIKKVSLDGFSFNAKADIDVSKKLSPYENEVLPSTGEGVNKKTIVNPDLESVTLLTSPGDDELLKDLNSRVTAFPMSIQLADNSIYRTTGFVNWEGTTTAENTATIKMMPSNALNGWTPFLA